MTQELILVRARSVNRMVHCYGITFALQFCLSTHIYIQEEIYILKILIGLRNYLFVVVHFTTHSNIKVHMLIGAVNLHSQIPLVRMSKIYAQTILMTFVTILLHNATHSQRA